MIVTFRPSVHYNPNTYCNERVENIVNLMLDIRERAAFGFLVQGILDLNVHVGDTRSWLQNYWPKRGIKGRSNVDQDKLKRAIEVLLRLKEKSNNQAENYFSVIVPKYILRKLERRYGENGFNDVYIRIEKQTTKGKYVWDSSQKQGSNTVDAAIWISFKQSGACYECKLDRAIKQDQIDLLSCIWSESDHKMEVGIASFASFESMKLHLLKYNVPNFLNIVARDKILSYGSP